MPTDPGAVGGPIVIPNCVQIRLIWLMADGRFAYNVLHGQVAGGFTPTVTIVNNILTGLATSASFTTMAAFMPTATQLAGCDMRDLRQANLPLIAQTVGGGAGTSAGMPLAVQTALVVTLRTGSAGRAFRGRAYIPNWASNAMAVGGVAAAGVEPALQAWVNTWNGVFSGQGITQCIGQKARQAYTGETGTQHPARTATPVPITQWVVRNNLFDTQRRRAGRT